RVAQGKKTQRCIGGPTNLSSSSWYASWSHLSLPRIRFSRRWAAEPAAVGPTRPARSPRGRMAGDLLVGLYAEAFKPSEQRSSESGRGPRRARHRRSTPRTTRSLVTPGRAESPPGSPQSGRRPRGQVAACCGALTSPRYICFWAEAVSLRRDNVGFSAVAAWDIFKECSSELR